MRAQGAGKRPQIIPPDECRMITGRNALPMSASRKINAAKIIWR